MPPEEDVVVESVNTDLAGGEQAPDSSASTEGEQVFGSSAPVEVSESITIDETGEVNFPDSVLESTLADFGKTEPQVEVEPGTQPVEEKPVEVTLPNAYTPQELAQAFLNNSVDSSRVPEGLQDYYKAIEEARSTQNSLAEVQQIDRNAQVDAFMAQKFIPPTPPSSVAQMSPQSFAQLQAHGKVLAAKYLGIEEADFDEFNGAHTNALTLAMNDIRERAQQIQVERYNKELQEYNKNVSMQNQVARARQLDGLIKEFKGMENWDRLNNVTFPKWFAGLDVNNQNAVNAIMQEGNPAKLKKLLQVVAASETPQAPKQVTPPPVVMSGSGQSDMKETKGMADASGLEGMSPEDKAAWFIQNKFV